MPDVSLQNFDISRNTFVRSDWNNHFHNGETSREVGFPGEEVQHLRTSYPYFKSRSDLSFRQRTTRDGRVIRYWHNWSLPPRGLRLMTAGTSFNEDLNHILPEICADMMYVRLISVQPLPRSEESKLIKHYADMLEEFKPDALALILTVNHLNVMKHVADEMEVPGFARESDHL